MDTIYNFIQTTPFFAKNVFNFILVIAFFIWLLFFKLDIIGLLDKKSKETAKTIKNSEDKNSQAQKYLLETQNSLKNVDNDVKKIVSDAKALAQTIEQQSQATLDKELQNLKDREEVLKKAYLHKAKDEVSTKIFTAAIAISREYIKNSLDENTHKELIYDFINNLDARDIE